MIESTDCLQVRFCFGMICVLLRLLLLARDGLEYDPNICKRGKLSIYQEMRI